MSLSISLRDVASSWGDTGKIVAATVVSIAAMGATEYLMNKTCNYFNIPNAMNPNIGQGALDISRRNHLIMGVSAVTMGLIAPAVLPMEFKQFNLSQNVQLATLDLLVYGAAKAAFRGNRFVESNGFRFLMLSQTLTGAAFAGMGSYSRLLVPGFFAVGFLANLNYMRERWAANDYRPNTLSGRFYRMHEDAQLSAARWIRQPVTAAAAPVVGPLPEA